ncbi:hypothetical protein M404DRAFT_712638 [Pisolithus tinctorius Marx 270]|uniref:Uncharacterized protein n=1 Tax=Pisolithus tinctorius Marx 270 TaxID=870435 RepID=A0A0C3NMG7_PISTI|nr:hypothetical protein M404DRAFT_712638 [Pisolithus tinctorius Marx 270]
MLPPRAPPPTIQSSTYEHPAQFPLPGPLATEAPSPCKLQNSISSAIGDTRRPQRNTNMTMCARKQNVVQSRYRNPSSCTNSSFLGNISYISMLTVPLTPPVSIPMVQIFVIHHSYLSEKERPGVPKRRGSLHRYSRGIQNILDMEPINKTVVMDCWNILYAHGSHNLVFGLLGKRVR